MVDITRPSTWTRFEPKRCSGCEGHCCKLHVDATLDDLRRMGCVADTEAMTSPKKIAKKLRDQKIIQSYNPNARTFRLAQRENLECVFLNSETKLCTIYERRPNVCRDFPDVGPRPGWCPASKKTSGTPQSDPVTAGAGR
jgi:uncharacterized protein